MGFPWLLISLLGLALLGGESREEFRRRFVGILGSLAVISTLATLTWGTRVYERDLEQAKIYCETVAERLDEYKSRFGAYPENLGKLELDFQPPIMLRLTRLRYRAENEGFVLEFNTRQFFLDLWQYNHATKAWRVYKVSD